MTNTQVTAGGKGVSVSSTRTNAASDGPAGQFDSTSPARDDALRNSTGNYGTERDGTGAAAGHVRDAHDPVVYFLRFGTHVKIGTTTNLEKRLKQIGVPGTVMFTIPGGHDQEADFHRYYARNRIEGSEWFELTPEMEAHLDVIRRNTEWLLRNPCDDDEGKCEHCYPYPRILRDLRPEITEEGLALEKELFRLLFGIEL